MTVKQNLIIIVIFSIVLEGQAFYRIPLRKHQAVKFDADFFSGSNTGSSSSFSSGNPNPFAGTTSSSSSASSSSTSSSNSSNSSYHVDREQINNYKNMQYYGDVFIGPSKQQFTCVWDTGSAWLWVPGTFCSNCNYANGHLYNCSSSTANCQYDQQAQLQYGKGGATGIYNTDTVSFGTDMTVSEQGMLVISSQNAFDRLKADGICGLGFETLSYGYPTFIDNLKTQGVIKEKQFSWYLDFAESEGTSQQLLSELIIGGYDPKYMAESSFTYAPVTNQYYWAVDVNDIGISGYPLQVQSGSNGKTVRALIDSGTSLIVLDPETFDAWFMVMIAAGNECSLDQNLGFYYCNIQGYNGYMKLPSFDVWINNKHMSLPPQDFLVRYQSRIYLLIMRQDFGLPTTRLVILGDIFMRRYYTIFNEDDMTIGFAAAVVNTGQSNSNSLRSISTVQELVDLAASNQPKGQQTPGSKNGSYTIPLLIAAGILIAIIVIHLVTKKREKVNQELNEGLITNDQELIAQERT